MDRVFVTRRIPDAGLERLHVIAEAEIWPGDEPPPYEALVGKLRDAAGLVCLLTDPVDADLIAGAPELRVISQMAVGVDNIDLRAATARGIPVGHTPGVLTETTADFAFALLMSAARRVVEGVEYVRSRKWKTWGPTLLMGHDVHGATLGLVGFGRIGQAVARRAQGFGMRVLFADPHVDDAAAADLGAQRVSFEQLLAESDFLSLHVPLTAETRHLIGAEELRRMKPSAILINTARGPVVDGGALYEALRTGEIAHAALDVTDPEPIPSDDPLLTLGNCVVVPHIASSSLATRGRMADMAVDNLEAGLRGEQLPHCANPEVYAR